MNQKELKKIVELQGRIVKLRSDIMKSVEKHNDMVVDQLRPLMEDVLHSTVYQHERTLYKRGRVFAQLDCQDHGTGIKAEGLATLRTVEVTDANIDDKKSRSTSSVS
tara:strand:+ start:2679 stop:2999 length:321 start_codon:yes stop_codon:yes gene_type:complete